MLTLRLPQPVPEGAVLRLRGLGEAPPREGGSAGDLYVELEPVDGAGDLVPSPSTVTAAGMPWVGAGVLALLLIAVVRACGG